MEGVITRVNFEKVRNKIQELGKEYRLSLKPKETEEILNQFFNRPLAYLTAKLFHKLKSSPNFVTMLSMAFGVSSGFLFAQGEYHYVLAAAILLELMIIFDCADGQLARMIRRSSPLGKTLDGLADITTHMAIFYGVAFALYRELGSVYPFFLGLVAQLSMYFHIILYDHFKNVFSFETDDFQVGSRVTRRQIKVKALPQDQVELGKLYTYQFLAPLTP